MAKNKEVRRGFHLKYIPAGRFSDLKILADNFPHIANKHIALCKYIETVSSIIERCWNGNVEFVGVSQRTLRDKLGIENKACAKLLNDLVINSFLIVNKSDFRSA